MAVTRRSQRRTSQAPPQDPSPAPAAHPANLTPSADLAASLPSDPAPPCKRPRTSAAAASKVASGAASAGLSSGTAAVDPSATSDQATQQAEVAALAGPLPSLPSRAPTKRKPPRRRIPSSDAEEEEEQVVLAPPPEATNPPPEPGNAILSVALDPLDPEDTSSAPEPSAPAVPKPLDQAATEVDRDPPSAMPLASPQDASGPTKTPQPITSLQATTPLEAQEERAPARGDDSVGATPVPVDEPISTPVAANLPLPTADQDMHTATNKEEAGEEAASTEQQAAATISTGASSGSIAQPSPKPGQSPAGKPSAPKANAARNPLNKIRSSKIAPGAPKPSSAGLKPTKSGAFDILKVLQPTVGLVHVLI